MGPLFEQLSRYLMNVGLVMRQVPNHPMVLITMEGTEDRRWEFVGCTEENLRLVAMWCRFPFVCPPERMPTMCEFIVRGNFQMLQGAFGMDHADGELRFTVSATFADISPSDALLGGMARYVNEVADQFYPSMKAIVDGTTEIDEALGSAFEPPDATEWA